MTSVICQCVLCGVYSIRCLMKSLVDNLRVAIRRDGRSLYAIAKAAGLRYPILHRIARGERDDMTTRTAEKIAAALGLRIELRPTGRRGKEG